MPTTKAILLYTRFYASQCDPSVAGYEVRVRRQYIWTKAHTPNVIRRRYDHLSGWKGNIVTPQSLDTTREDLGPVVLALITKKAMKELLGPEPVDDKAKDCLCRLLLDPTQSLPSPPSSTWEVIHKILDAGKENSILIINWFENVEPANRTHMWESLGKVVLQHERTDKLVRKYLELVDKLSQSNESMIYWKAAFHHNFKQLLAICLFTAYRPDNFKAVFSRIWVNNGDEAGYKALCMEWDKFRALRRGAGQQLSITELISILEGLPGPDANSNSEESYQESQILKKLLDHMQTSNPDDTEASEGARGRVGQMEGSSSMM
ncbi:hypothetical protein B0H14DRAFT_2615834 [Mycena olivaceomarginata]|nr:hypothetical protein B0H14DRAFT_2615834 [Mycena olivaceomarginata]